MGAPISKDHALTNSSPKYDLNHFAVITVIFNPFKYQSRYELYHKFDEHMSRCGVTLLTVECIFDVDERLGLPQQKFEITRSNDPRHLQIKAPSVLWLKENLINIAVRRLPSYIEYVAWLDADIEFEDLNWPHLTIAHLQNYQIVQLFQMCLFLGPSGKKQVLRSDYSFVYAMQHKKPTDPYRSPDRYYHPGCAWAMRRQAFESIGGLLDISIIGAGDVHFAYALFNRIEETIPVTAHVDYQNIAQTWGNRVATLAENGDNVGYLPINIWHHWHGHRGDRRYEERWNILEEYLFSPLTDLRKNDKIGLIRLASYQTLKTLHNSNRLELIEKSIIRYFRLRDEDNVKKPLPTTDTNSVPNEPIILPNDAYHASDDLHSLYIDISWLDDSNINSPNTDSDPSSMDNPIKHSTFREKYDRRSGTAC